LADAKGTRHKQTTSIKNAWVISLLRIVLFSIFEFS
jgi:hypothetical protein